MRDGIIYDCPNANCRTPIYTGKCSKACIEKYNKEIGIKPKTNADRIRAMSDEEIAQWLCLNYSCTKCLGQGLCTINDGKANGLLKWLKQPVED